MNIYYKMIIFNNNVYEDVILPEYKRLRIGNSRNFKKNLKNGNLSTQKYSLSNKCSCGPVKLSQRLSA